MGFSDSPYINITLSNFDTDKLVLEAITQFVRPY